MDINRHRLLAHVATLYYERELTQSEIGKELELSRVKVYRLLKEARAAGIVDIRINWPVERQPRLEEALGRIAALKGALVLRSGSGGEAANLPGLGHLGAQYLEQVLRDGMTLGICMGSSTYEVINAISPDFRAQVRVAQATGSIPLAVDELDASAVARHLAQKLGGEVLYLPSPLVADSIEAAMVLRHQTDIKRTLDIAASADVALLGIGALDVRRDRCVHADLVASRQLSELKGEGAVGDMAGQIFTESGELHPGSYNQKVVGVGLDGLRRIPMVIAVASGVEKASAILGALRTGVVDVLITDDRTAGAVLERNGG